MQAWTAFYGAMAAAAASLLGLLFVAVSINAEETIGPGRENARRLAEQAFQNYLTVLLVSLLALIPQIDIRTLGIATVWVTAAWTAVIVVRLYRSMRNRHAENLGFAQLRRHVTSLVGFALLLYAALQMANGRADNRLLYAAGLIVLLSSATMVSWEFLLRVAMRERAPTSAPTPP